MSSGSYNLIELIKITLKWKKHIIVISFLGTLIGLFLAFYLKPYYKSSSQFYIYNQKTSDPIALLNIYNNPELMVSQITDQFGNKEDASRILSIAESDEIINHVIKKFNLANHYQYDTIEPKYIVNLVKDFKSNYNYIKNDDGSITITIYDQDKQMAADIANEIVRMIEIKYDEILRSNRHIILDVFVKRLSDKKTELNTISDSLELIKSKFGIYNIYRDYDNLTTNLVKIEGMKTDYEARLAELKTKLSDNDTSVIRTSSILKGLTAQYDKMIGKTKGPTASLRDFDNIIYISKSLQSRFEIVFGEVLKLANGYVITKNEIETKLPTIYILNKATPALEKSRPVRWILVVASFVISLVFSLFAVLSVELYNKNIKHLLD